MAGAQPPGEFRAPGHVLSRLRRKVFIADDKFGDVVRALERRGWQRQVRSPGATFFDLKWRNGHSIRYDRLRAHQMANHFSGSRQSARKTQLCHLLTADDAAWQYFPLCFPLRGGQDIPSVEAAAASCEAIARLAPASGHSDTEELSSLVERVRRALSALNAPCPPPDCPLPEAAAALSTSRWIVKPSFRARGEGIHVCSSSEDAIAAARDLLREDAEGRGDGVVVQRYITRPLLVHGRKFDIRQWVLVSHVDPLRVFAFGEPYLRFCAAPYREGGEGGDGDDDRYMHLSNNSIQRHGPAFRSFEQAPELMWTAKQFQRHLKERLGEDAWADRLKPRIWQVVAQTCRALRSCMEAREGSFEWFGLDLLVDEALGVHLLEVNVSPDVSHSTAVLAALVPAATEDAMQILLGERPVGAPLIQSLDGPRPRVAEVDGATEAGSAGEVGGEDGGEREPAPVPLSDPQWRYIWSEDQ